MTTFNKIKRDIIEQLKSVAYNGADMSDIGNEIGIAIGKYTTEKHSKVKALDIDSFIDGLKHGVSLVDGTH